MKANLKVIIVIVLLAAVLFAKFYKGISQSGTNKVKTVSQDNRPTGRVPGESDNTAQGHQTVISPDAHLIYTKHARCRMDCRHISEADIKEVIREGHINEAKSQQNQTPCPTYAIEDNRNSDGIRLRIVFAKCENEVKVVTCIDRDDEFACDCK